MGKERHYRIMELRGVINLEDCRLLSISSRLFSGEDGGGVIALIFRLLYYITCLSYCEMSLLLVRVSVDGRKVSVWLVTCRQVMGSHVIGTIISQDYFMFLVLDISQRTTSCLRHVSLARVEPVSLNMHI